jgi:hypothetical protein
MRWLDVPDDGAVTGDAATPSSTQSEQLTRSLRDGYESYYTPTDADYRALLTTGLVVLDANALLNLYRYTPDVRTSLLNVMTRVGDQLWEPAQVIKEFWHRRESAIRDYSAAALEFNTKTEAAKNGAMTAVRALSNRIGLDESIKKTLCEPLDAAFSELSKSVAGIMSADDATEVRRDTNRDPVLLPLEQILRNRVGLPFEGKALQEAITEAQRRISSKEPPGYMDSKKDELHSSGDYLVWAQMVAESKARGRDVLFVTGDTKEDWWRSWGGNSSAGPRFELLDEFHAKTGQRFLMLQPADFLSQAAKVLDVTVKDESVEQVRRIDHNRTSFIREALDYEEGVIEALIRVQSEEGLEGRPYANAGRVRADFLLSDGVQLVAVEIRRRIDARRSREILEYADRLLSSGAHKMLVVSRDEIGQSILERLSSSPIEIAYAQWQDPTDDHHLKSAVHWLFADSREGNSPEPERSD